MESFGLGYVGWESPNYKEMAGYAPEVFGFGLHTAQNDDATYLTMDDAAFRIAIHPGPENRLIYLGHEMKDKWAFETGVEELRSKGFEVTIGDEELEAKRHVFGVAQFRDPAGWPHELFYGQQMIPRHFRPGRGHAGFYMDRGFHTVLFASNQKEIEEFCKDVMQFRFTSEGLRKNSAGFWRSKNNLMFHNCAYAYNPNHRYGDTASSLPHIGIYCKDLDDVGIAYDLVPERGGAIELSLGKHTHDPVLSFYSRTPAGFTLEYIWMPTDFPDATWIQHSHSRVSVWGHKPVAGPDRPTPEQAKEETLSSSR